jgi:predicted ATPase/DNA-binding SARP family transcriptional activator
MTPPPLAIQLFETLRVTVRGEPLPRVRTRSVEWLLALLTLRHGQAVNRAWLAGTLWPESSGSRSLQNLRDDLLRLRKALGPESGRLQAPARDLLTIELGDAVVDVVQFDAAIRAGDEASLRRAVAVYTGPLLEECSEEWAFTARATRAEQYLVALEALADRAAGRGEHPEAIPYLRRAEALDPLRDSLPRRLMASLAAAGDPAAAIQTYRDFRLRLQEELAAAPDEATTHLFHEIRAAARHQAGYPLAGGRRLAPAPPSATAEARSPHPPSEPLLRPLTSLIGRERELEQIQGALEQARLVTLVGGGGLGKTRLALGVALQADEVSPNGAAWVELGPLADGTLVLPSVATALGIRKEGGAFEMDALTERLIARLAEGAPLLVLDNCEHLLDAMAALVRLLLQRCPELRVLATSRQRLGLPGEVAWRVPSLAVPDPEQLPAAADEAVAAAVSFAAVRLFVERAETVQPGFQLESSADAAAVSLVCRRLDGIPLAIELAAARVRVLTPEQIAERLEQRFTLLTRGARGALPRHQTLRALIDWSYDSLPGAEATLLRRLSVFAGGWTLEAAEAVCSDPSDRMPGPHARIQHWEIFDLLDALVDRSLVLVDEVAEGLRYRMLETVQEYAREKRDESGERTATRNRHRDWYLQRAELAEAEVLGPGRGPAWRSLEAELDNCRAALAWCQEETDAHSSSDAADTLFRLTHALCLFFGSGHGFLTESLRWLEGALARGRHLPAERRASALMRAAHVAYVRGDRDRSRTFCKAARGDYQTVLELARRDGERRRVAWALLWLAEVTTQDDDDDTAWDLFVEARPLFEGLNEPAGLISTLNWLARIALKRGDRGAARSMYEEHLAICRQWGDASRLFHALGGMGHLERDDDNYSRARVLYQESLVLRRKAEDQTATAQSLEDLAVLAGREQQLERAIRLLGAAEAFCETFGAQQPVADAPEYDRSVAEGRAALGEAGFAAAWAEGRAMSVEQAVAYALLAPHDPAPAA